MRVRECQLQGLLKPRIYLDLIGTSEAAAKRDILGIWEERGKPDQKPSFPGVSSRVASKPVEFPTSAKQRLPWNIPFPRNPFFTGRDELLSDLRNQLTQTSAAALSQPAAISGLGGIGKTQTAIEYAYRYRDAYSAVFWVRAESEDRLISGFMGIAELLKLPGRDQQDQQIVVAAAKHWLNEHENWLLIFDNANELNLLRNYLPREMGGHVLITTRAQAIGTFGQRIELRQMQTDEGATFLLRRARIILDSQCLDDASDADRQTAQEIANLMDGLPLALDQAGAFIEEMMISLSEYQDLYQQEGIKLLAERGELAGERSDTEEDHHPVTITFSLAFKKVEERNPAAADLLRVCAFLAPDAIPEEIFVEGKDVLGERLSKVTQNRVALTRTIAEAAKFSLVYRNPDAKTLDMHRLVQDVLRDEMDEEGQKTWTDRAMRAVNAAFPNPEFENWSTCDRLLLHATTVIIWRRQFQLKSEAAGRLLNQTGYYLRERGNLNEAETLYQEVLVLSQNLFGDRHSYVATILNNLAGLYDSRGNYTEAESLYKQALELRLEALGDRHPDVATSLNNLAELYRSQGHYEAAEPLYLEALQIQKELLGDTRSAQASQRHPDVAGSLNNLAECRLKFSTLLLKQIGNQIELNERAIPKATTLTEYVVNTLLKSYCVLPQAPWAIAQVFLLSVRGAMKLFPVLLDMSPVSKQLSDRFQLVGGRTSDFKLPKFKYCF
ncbi:MAG: tetratricopeptide repeat protein [Elainellaceae cyanobacterium]